MKVKFYFVIISQSTFHNFSLKFEVGNIKMTNIENLASNDSEEKRCLDNPQDQERRANPQEEGTEDSVAPEGEQQEEHTNFRLTVQAPDGIEKSPSTASESYFFKI